MAQTIFDIKRFIGRNFDDKTVQADRKVWRVAVLVARVQNHNWRPIFRPPLPSAPPVLDRREEQQALR